MGFDLGHWLFGGTTNVGADLTGAGYKPYDPNAAAYQGINPNVGVTDATMNPALAGPFREQQLDMMRRLQAQAGGQGFSAAQDQLEKGNAEAIRNQMGAAAENNPQAGGAAGYQAAMGAGNIESRNAADAATLRAQEAQGGMAGAAGLASTGAGQGIGVGEFNVGNQMQGAEFNSQAQQLLDQQRQKERDQFNQNIAGGINSENTSGGQAVGLVGAIKGGGGGAARGRVVTHPQTIRVGEHGQPEAIIPIGPYGVADMTRATDPGVVAFLDQNPGYREPLAASEYGMPAVLPEGPPPGKIDRGVSPIRETPKRGAAHGAIINPKVQTFLDQNHGMDRPGWGASERGPLQTGRPPASIDRGPNPIRETRSDRGLSGHAAVLHELLSLTREMAQLRGAHG